MNPVELKDTFQWKCLQIAIVLCGNIRSITFIWYTVTESGVKLWTPLSHFPCGPTTIKTQMHDGRAMQTRPDQASSAKRELSCTYHCTATTPSLIYIMEKKYINRYFKISRLSVWTVFFKKKTRIRYSPADGFWRQQRQRSVCVSVRGHSERTHSGSTITGPPHPPRPAALSRRLPSSQLPGGGRRSADICWIPLGVRQQCVAS